MFSELVAEIRQKFSRHREKPLNVLTSKATCYASSIASAYLYLRQVDEVGQRVRTIGRPRIENFGFMQIGNSTILRSINVPVELCTEADATLRIGDACSLNYGVSVGATQRIEIGHRVRFGPYVMVVDSEFHDLYQRAKRPTPRPVVIEDDVWIAAKASILPGVTIGRGSVIGASSVVNKDVPPFSVAVGVPAKVVKKIDPDKFRLENQKP